MQQGSAHRWDKEQWKHAGGPSTMYEMFEHGLKASGKRPFLGRRAVYQIGIPVKLLPDYEWISFEEVAKQRNEVGSGLFSLISDEQLNLRVGVYSVNRPEWVIADQAMHAYSLVNVALYDTLGANALEFIINHAEINVVFCSGDRIPNLLQIAKKCPTMKHIISLDNFNETSASNILNSWAYDYDVKLHDFSSIRALGRERAVPHRPPRETDLCAICYTSGTTGNPKGASYIHRMQACAIKNFEESGIILNKDVVHLSYLPLAHCYEKTFVSLMCFYGARVGFNSGDVLRLAEDAKSLKPNIFLGVPRVYNKMYDAIRAQTIEAPGLKGVIARMAYTAKHQNLVNSKTFIHPVWDRLLFKKVAAILGGNVRYFITGSAPVDHKVMQFFRIMFSCEFCEGYGSTESCAYGSVIPVGDFEPNHVGKPPSCSEVKLIAVPEMNYDVVGPIPKGELCYRGPFVFPGYYKDPEKTAEAVDSDGWLHTGDIASYNPKTGKLAIIDRKKNIFKLSQGEYIAPENLENGYINSNWVAQIFVHGDSLKSDLVAIIVPNEEVIQAYFKQQGRPINYKDQQLYKVIQDDLNKVAKEQKLNGYEYIKAFYLEKEQFTIEKDLLTPTFKLKRHQARIYFEKQIEALYKQIEEPEARQKSKI